MADDIQYRIVCTEIPEDVLTFDGDDGSFELARVESEDYDRPVGSVFIRPDDARELADALTAWAEASEANDYRVVVYYSDGSSLDRHAKAATYAGASDAVLDKLRPFIIKPNATVVTGDEGVRCFQISRSYDA